MLPYIYDTHTHTEMYTIFPSFHTNSCKNLQQNGNRMWYLIIKSSSFTIVSHIKLFECLTMFHIDRNNTKPKGLYHPSIQCFEQRLRKWFRHLFVLFFFFCKVPVDGFGPYFYCTVVFRFVLFCFNT